MSPTDSSAADRIPRVKVNVYTALAILSSVFLAGGIALLYLTIEPYTMPPRRITTTAPGGYIPPAAPESPGGPGAPAEEPAPAPAEEPAPAPAPGE
jgi:hypothetical protein